MPLCLQRIWILQGPKEMNYIDTGSSLDCFKLQRQLLVGTLLEDLQRKQKINPYPANYEVMQTNTNHLTKFDQFFNSTHTISFHIS